MRFMVRRKNIGIDVKTNGRTPAHTYSPFIRGYEYFKQLFEGRVSHDTYESMKKELDALKRSHTVNTGGIIDDDQFIEFILKCSSIKEDSGLAYLKALFNIADVISLLDSKYQLCS